MSFWNRGKGHAKREAATAQRYYSEATAAAKKQREETEAQKEVERKKLNEKQGRAFRSSKRRPGFSQEAQSGTSSTVG